MANPAPIIQKINAFDATQGTTINFNIIGGTELVQSNKIYIYSVTTNELIVTHTYTGTQSIHVLPSNTDSSMEYATGKTSADFTNENQYYARIQTFTNKGATQGGSGISVSSLFWCLLAPTIAFDSITSPIDTTSYNFIVKYNTNITTAQNVTNKLQQYQFDLYDGSGKLESTSGSIIGSGTPTTVPQQYQIEYNFTGLNNNETYYAKVTCVSTEGMIVTAQSATITVQTNVGTFNKAKVSNNACNGYISVISQITNIEGKTNVEDISGLQGEIDLRNGKYVTWDSGFTFPTVNSYGQWTIQLQGRGFDISGDTDNESYLINLSDSGQIYIYIRQNDETPSQTRADMYVYPYGIEYNMSLYLYSNYIDNPTVNDKLDVWIRCIKGMYEIKLTNLSA